jgi:hypothetical protein
MMTSAIGKAATKATAIVDRDECGAGSHSLRVSRRVSADGARTWLTKG